MRLPHQYSRRILLLVSGMSPQIVTETLFALTQTAHPAFIPTEIHLISTTTGASQARLTLLEGPQHFYRLCDAYGLDSGTFSADHIHVICDSQGRAMADIRTPEENEAMADFISARIHDFTQDTDCALHVSMAGGRKTMGYYAGYALSLFGRHQDRLSHVLVSEGYEGLIEFYYPTKSSHTIHDRKGMALDAAKANISLAEIPFVRLREGIHPDLIEGQLTFNKAIALSQVAEKAPSLVINVKEKCLICHGLPVRMQASDFAFYVWIAARPLPVRSKEIVKSRPRNSQYAKELLEVYSDIEGEMRDNDRVADALSEGMSRQYFDTKKSEVRNELKRQLGQRIAQHYEIRRLGSTGNSQFMLGLDRRQVEWIGANGLRILRGRDL